MYKIAEYVSGDRLQVQFNDEHYDPNYGPTSYDVTIEEFGFGTVKLEFNDPIKAPYTDTQWFPISTIEVIMPLHQRYGTPLLEEESEYQKDLKIPGTVHPDPTVYPVGTRATGILSGIRTVKITFTIISYPDTERVTIILDSPDGVTITALRNIINIETILPYQSITHPNELDHPPGTRITANVIMSKNETRYCIFEIVSYPDNRTVTTKFVTNDDMVLHHIERSAMQVLSVVSKPIIPKEKTDDTQSDSFFYHLTKLKEIAKERGHQVEVTII